MCALRLVSHHLGDPPEPVNTAAVIGVALCNHAEALAPHRFFPPCINASFLSALEDPDFGVGDVRHGGRTMLEHLRAEYGTLTPEELEKTRAALSET